LDDHHFASIVERMSLKNARVLVIGGTSGIGLAVASAAAEKGATPIVVSRRQSSVDRALAELPDRARAAPPST
jgi:NAD(P)-dependent dehydrogenase (short-subunit alcohol dehydrogenase family)